MTDLTWKTTRGSIIKNPTVFLIFKFKDLHGISICHIEAGYREIDKIEVE